MTLFYGKFFTKSNPAWLNGILVVGSSFVKQALEGEYPKFLRVFLDLRKRLKEKSQAAGTYALG